MEMIGEMIGELSGKVVGQRVAKHHHGLMKRERTLEAKGKILGTGVTFLATTCTGKRPQGGLITWRHGVMTTRSGEKAETRGSGIGVMGRRAGTSIREVRGKQ